MRKHDEAFEMEYLVNDINYLKYYCSDEGEAYEIEREMKYDSDCWLFERPTRSYNLEDDYGEDSMP